jgi:hypothetical protein
MRSQFACTIPFRLNSRFHNHPLETFALVYSILSIYSKKMAKPPPLSTEEYFQQLLDANGFQDYELKRIVGDG